MKKPQQIFVGGDLTKITEAYELLCKLGYQSFDSTGVDFWVMKNAQYLVIGLVKNYIDYNFSIEPNYETIDCAYLRSKIMENGKIESHNFKVKNNDVKFNKYLDESFNVREMLMSENVHEVHRNWIKIPDKAEILMKLSHPNGDYSTLHFYGKDDKEDDKLLVSDVYQSDLEGKWLTSDWSRTGYFNIPELINVKGMQVLWRDDTVNQILDDLDNLIGESVVDEDSTVKEENKFKMKSVVHKYAIPFQEGFELNLPRGSQVVRIDTIDGFNFLWALHEVSDNPEIVTYKFVSSKTGGEIEHEKPLTFVGMYSIFIQMELLLYVFLEDIVDSSGDSIISEYDKTQSTCWRG